jgi:tetratricopeptide (TPR) repeat protein
MTITSPSARAILIAAAVVFGAHGSASTVAAGPKADAAAKASGDKDRDKDREKVPITTVSPEARTLYLEGRNLLETLRVTDARRRFEAAVEQDRGFALGYLGLANTAPSTHDFFAAVERAVALADKASPPERLMIRGLQAGATGKPAQQKALYAQLVQAYPRDERALTLLATFYFGQQDYPKAIDYYTKAVAIDPSFTSPYNLLGYAYRAIERYADAEKAFQKYIELIPGDPNPYDSYGEMLMKVGRFDESIKSYEKALAIDGNFISAYVGIANCHMFSGRGDAARAQLAKLTKVARSDGERRQAMAWTAESFIHEAAWDKATAEIDRMIAVSDQAGDLGQKANDLNFKANTLLEAGRADDAAAAFAAGVAASEQSTTPADVKETARRNTLYDQARVALVRRDVAGAKTAVASYAKQVAIKQIPFEVRRQHELAGLIALAERKPKIAVAELAQANQQDPRVLYLYAAALADAGDANKAQAAARKAADFNALSLNYGYVRVKAKALTKA